MTDFNKEALEYHRRLPRGKLEIRATKPMATQNDLSLAYSPGVAEPARMIAESQDQVFEYTARGNLVAVVTNGTAVLGLGNIGPYAAKPVMEGKAVLFKKLADIDCFDIELNAPTAAEVIKACEMLEPSFGGINLEDIKAPECFEIEETLKKKLQIPVFHDDQHGTAIILGAAVSNALELLEKKIDEIRCVFIGGGAACIACAKMFLSLGVKPENLVMTDLDGVIYKGRKKGMNPFKEEFARDTPLRSLAEACAGADVLVGLSAKGAVSPDMVKSMAKNPIVFAMANPEPEITPEEVQSVRTDAIMATGRSDYPNQVNNVLGFPYMFRGALDVRAKTINEEMKLAAVQAIARLAKEEVPESVIRAYGGKSLHFGREYLLPKPTDRRALLWVAPAVAKAAMDSGVARIKLDLPKYRESLERLLGASYMVMSGVKRRVRIGQEKKPILVFPEGENPKILRSALRIKEEGIAEPILLARLSRLPETPSGIQVITPSDNPQIENFANILFEKRGRKGMTVQMARALVRDQNYFGAMLVETGQADGMVSGISSSYPEAIRPAIHVIGVKPGCRLAGIYLMIFKRRVLWFADTTVNIDPTAEDLADVAIQTADFSKRFNFEEPRIAMLSFSNFGSTQNRFTEKSRKAVEIVRKLRPDLTIDGEMQADTAVVPDISSSSFPFNLVPGDANVLIFPDLQSGNIAYKLLWRLGGAEAIGPLLVGMQKPMAVLQQNCDVEDVVNVAAITAMEVRAKYGTQA